MVKNLIVLCGGNSQRFINDGYPNKCLLPTKNDNNNINILLFNSIDNIISQMVELPKNIVIVLSEYLYDQFNKNDSLLNKYFNSFIKHSINNLSSRDINIHYIKGSKNGALESALFGVKHLLDVEKNNEYSDVLISNVDQFIYYDGMNFNSLKNIIKYSQINSRLNVGGILFHHYEQDKSTALGYSTIDIDGYITQIHEKQPITPFSHTGHYYFSNITSFIKYAKQVIDKNIKINNEYFLSSVIQEMINDKIRFVSYFVDEFICLGTPKDYEKYMKQDSDTYIGLLFLKLIKQLKRLIK